MARIGTPGYVSGLGRTVYWVLLLRIAQAVHGNFDIGKDMNDFANLAETVGNIFGASNDCKFSCPKGYKQIKNPAHSPTSNGCGSYGVKVIMDKFPRITSCCNKHDGCYDTCGSDKLLCDHKFKSCIKSFCDTVTDNASEQTCKSVAKIFFGGTAVFGCSAYVSAQEKACLCKPMEQSSKRRQEL